MRVIFGFKCSLDTLTFKGKSPRVWAKPAPLLARKKQTNIRWNSFKQPTFATNGRLSAFLTELRIRRKKKKLDHIQENQIWLN